MSKCYKCQHSIPTGQPSHIVVVNSYAQRACTPCLLSEQRMGDLEVDLADSQQFETRLREALQRAEQRELEAVAEIGELRAALRNLLSVALSGDEARLLLVGIGGIDVSPELHSRCDKITQFTAQAHAALAALKAKGGAG